MLNSTKNVRKRCNFGGDLGMSCSYLRTPPSADPPALQNVVHCMSGVNPSASFSPSVADRVREKAVTLLADEWFWD